MKLLSIRVTQAQLARLQELAAKDGLTQQEHIRRALDAYLDEQGAPRAS